MREPDPTSAYGLHQYDSFTRKMLSPGAPTSRSIARPVWNVPMLSESDRFWVHTRKSVEPGEYSHRSTAFPLSDASEKLGSSISSPAAGPEAPSGSTTIRSGSSVGAGS